MITLLKSDIPFVVALILCALAWCVGRVQGYLICHKEWHTKAKELMKEPHA